MINTSRQHIAAVITPSVFSGLVTGIASISITAFAVVASFGSNGILLQGLFAANNLSAPTYHQITDNLARNTVISNIPLFIFWAAVGLIVYLFAINIVKAFGSGVLLEEELSYVNSQRSKLIKFEIMVACIRAAILVGWLLYVQVFMRLLLPYALAVAQAVRMNDALFGTVQVCIAVLLLFVSIHLNLVLLRLFLLKTRVFAGNDDI
jgi:hypothetical protein